GHQYTQRIDPAATPSWRYCGRWLAHKMRHSPNMLLNPENLFHDSPAELSDVAHALQKRADLIHAWLSELGSSSGLDQRRSEQGAAERVYWHYGYTTAIRDALDFLRRNAHLLT